MSFPFFKPDGSSGSNEIEMTEFRRQSTFSAHGVNNSPRTPKVSAPDTSGRPSFQEAASAFQNLGKHTLNANTLAHAVSGKADSKLAAEITKRMQWHQDMHAEAFKAFQSHDVFGALGGTGGIGGAKSGKDRAATVGAASGKDRTGLSAITHMAQAINEKAMAHANRQLSEMIAPKGKSSKK